MFSACNESPNTTMSNNNPTRDERIQNAARIIRKVQSEAKRLEMIQELSEKDSYDFKALLAEVGRDAIQRLEEEAEMPLPVLTPELPKP